MGKKCYEKKTCFKKGEIKREKDILSGLFSEHLKSLVKVFYLIVLCFRTLFHLTDIMVYVG